LNTHSRIDHAEHDVGEEVTRKREERHEKCYAEHGGDVERGGGVDDLNTEPAVVEDALDNDGTTQEGRDVEAENDDDWP
jgi:hypothetical protein